jgi:hypothetical protein
MPRRIASGSQKLRRTPPRIQCSLNSRRA